jgi:hypothetical protein
MAQYASMVVVATRIRHQTANISQSFYTMYVPRVPARLSSRARVLGSRPGLRVLTLPRLQLVDLTLEPLEAKSEGLVEHARR